MGKQNASPPEGLPEIAEASYKKPVFLIVLGGLLLLLSIHFYFSHRKSNNKMEFAVEENYTLPTKKQAQITPYSAVKETNLAHKKQLTEQQLALLQAKQKELQKRLASPILLFVQQESNNPSNDAETMAKPLGKISTTDPNSQFLQQTSTAAKKTIQATKLPPLNQLIGEGQLIHAILETAINSDLPGSLRAIIDQPVYAEAGSQILIPSGSRLIGQYKSGMLQGQSRVFVVWTRLITPQGVSLNLASPGVDSLGMAGLSADTIDRHFWQQFGSAALLSVLGAGTSNAGAAHAPYNASQAYRIAIANSLNQTAQQTLQQGVIPATLWINQGSPVQVFVTQDLDFRSVHQETNSKIAIF